jgi:hypothetical protein
VQKGDGNKIYFVQMASETEFATAGVRHFGVWTITKGSFRGKKAASFGSKATDIACSLTDHKGKYLMGMPTGEVIEWSGPSQTKRQSLFKTCVDAVEALENYIFCGDRTGNVTVTNEQLQPQFSFSINQFQT